MERAGVPRIPSLSLDSFFPARNSIARALIPRLHRLHRVLLISFQSDFTPMKFCGYITSMSNHSTVKQCCSFKEKY